MCYVTEQVNKLNKVEIKNWDGDKRPKLHGWAPGDYISRCFSCDEQFIGDKRAIHCADCAYGTKEHP
ncbi:MULTISPECIES: hypothetical protein [unclassified Bradyrhizobium]|uniref:hypothetical protein n=1 Tax=unclassified Bradyrhizobium TaxID=2631580 RepID=UPI0029161C0C|nr:MULTISPECIES: hypothetical protein [unclassified Bradyrhizobium]